MASGGRGAETGEGEDEQKIKKKRETRKGKIGFRRRFVLLRY